MPLRDLGFSPSLEKLYVALLTDRFCALEELMLLLNTDADEVRRLLSELVELRVARPQADAACGVVATSPRTTVGRLIELREDDLMRQLRQVGECRADLAELETIFTSAGRENGSGADANGVERVDGLRGIRDRIDELSFFARTSIYAIHPGGPQSAESIEASRPLDHRALRRKLDVRVVHEETVVDDELNRAYLDELVRHGAQVRTTRNHIDRMIIIDEQVAVVPVDPADSAKGALIVRHPGLLAGFVDLFSRTWTDSTDLWGTEQCPEVEAGVSTQDRRILELLARGCTDETSAREVGVSVRHLRRSISRLMQELGATSRFEAGVEAARRGWL